MTSILIVEDERVVAEDLAETLAQLGYDISGTAGTSDDALAQAAARGPDLVLMDVRIRGPRDGIETARILRRRQDTPVIYLTAFADEATIGRARDTAPYGYLVKPFRGAELRSTIEIALHKHALDAQLRARERWFATTLRAIGDGVIAIDPHGVITFVNTAAEALLATQAVGKDVRDVLALVDERSRAPIADLGLRALAERRPVTPPGAVVVLGPAGERPLEACATPIIDHAQLLGAAIVLRDISAQRALQEQTVHHDRLRALGTLAAGVAHEINNPLTYVLGGASFLSELARGGAHLPAAAITAIQEIEHGVRRVRRIVADLGMFGRGERDDDRPVDVAATVGWAVRMTASQLRARARVVTRLEPTPPVLGNDTRLGQVVLNLLTNAAQAIEEGHAAAHQITVSSGALPDGAVRIEVTDTGCGIPADVVGRVFDPFFTTKPVGVGTGLGLSICHGIVTAMGGTLTVTSAPGRGSTFTVRLPATLPWPVAEAPGAVEVQPRRGRILIIDDEPLIVKLLVHVIGDAHAVVAAGGGREALAIIDADRTFDVILCDLTMPDLNGIDLYERLKDAHPELLDRLVFLTGGAHTPRARAFVAQADVVVIEKPVETATLLRLIAARLAPHDPGA